jgi:stage V sporulation protein D (sporulation-specific penicillin-binding protein)
MNNQTPFRSRIRIVAVVFFAFACILVTKLFFVQVVHSGSYADRADKQYATPVGDMFERGSIFFTSRDNTLVAAGTVMTGFKIAINPKNVTDAEALFLALTHYTKMPHDEFITRATKSNDPYEEVANHLSKEDADAVTAMKIPGVSIYKEKWRFYPGGTLASHTLGFVAYKGDDRVGQYGLEKFYNSVLSKPIGEAYVNFFAEVFSNIGKSFTSQKNGDLVTTIDPAIQHMLEEEMHKTFEEWNADQMGAIIMDPRTGEIYAMADMPDFNLNDFKEVKNPYLYSNPLVENVFEFGSVIKPLVMESALDAGVITPETTYFDAGKIIVDKKAINNFDLKGRGMVNMQTVLDQSLNTGMVFVESKLGHDKFRDYMKAFGIGKKTGIDVPNETTGLIKNLDSPRNIEYANAAFGQGIAMTPFEAIRAFASIGNGGVLVTPHLVKEIKYDDGTSKTLEWSVGQNGIKNPTASGETITRMLVNVFDKAYGEGKYKFDHYSVATKTGTAQVAQENGKGYYEDRHMHSFFGYFPAYDPKFIVFLYLKNPKQIKYASQTLIPPFVNVTKFLINYYNIPPDR